MKTFADLQLAEPLCRSLAAQKYEIPTDIQASSIPHLLTGGDLLGSAQTGTGKTASFALPVLHHIMSIGKRPRKFEVRALVMTPTRELAEQVSDSFRRYSQFTKLETAVVYGGVSYGPQIKALRKGVDVLVATPGRLMDLFGEGHLDLEHVQHLIVDEADRMLDMGFKKDLEKIISELPKKRQTILFSATVPSEIENFAKKILDNPKRVNVSPATITAQNIEESVVFVKSGDKNALLVDLLKKKDIERAIVFTRTKYIAERLSKKLKDENISADAIHGDKTQGARKRSLEKFRRGKAKVLVATDVASRGIDVDGISHVINFQLSHEAESYVHRIGRTARAGESGIAVTLCDASESDYLKNVEKFLKRQIRVDEENEFHDADIAKKHLSSRGSKPKSGRGKRGGARRSGPRRGGRSNTSRGGSRRRSTGARR